MECAKALEYISGHIDKQNTPQEEAELQAHLSACPDCRARLQAYELIDENVAALTSPVPENLAPSIMDKIKQEAAMQPAKKKKRSPWLSVSTAAGLVAAVLVLLIGTKAINLPKRSANAAPDRAMSMVAETAADAEGAADAPLFAAVQAPEGTEMPMESFAGIESAAADSMAELDEAADNSGDFKTTATEALVGGVRHLPHRSAPITAEIEEACAALSKDNGAAVLVYSGLDTDFLEWLKAYAPELSAQLTEHGSTEADPDTGIVTVTSDYATVVALQEWFGHTLLDEKSEAETDSDLLDEIRGQLALYGLDGSHLAKIYTFPESRPVIEWTDILPDGFIDQWIAGENWRLFYPEEGYTASDDDMAYLMLIPSDPVQ